MSWRFALALLAACAAPAERVAPPEPPRRPPPEPVVRPAVVAPVRVDLAVPTAPTSLVTTGGVLYWTDALGAIWTMRTDGTSPARQLSDGQKPGFAFHVFRAGERVFATSRKDLLRVDADGTVKALGLKLPELPEESVGDADALYITMFKRSDVLRIGAADTTRSVRASVSRGVLGQHGDTLYIASYSTGTLSAVPKSRGPAVVIATNLPRPTAVAADDEAAYVFCERDHNLRRIDLATREVTVIARELENSDDLVADGKYLWTISWGPDPGLVRIAKDGSSTERVTKDLRHPTKLAVDAGSVYVSSREENRIVRLPK